MKSKLDNLVKIGSLKQEAAAASELAGLLASGRARLKDAASTEEARRPSVRPLDERTVWTTVVSNYLEPS